MKPTFAHELCPIHGVPRHDFNGDGIRFRYPVCLECTQAKFQRTGIRNIAIPIVIDHSAEPPTQYELYQVRRKLISRLQRFLHRRRRSTDPVIELRDLARAAGDSPSDVLSKLRKFENPQRRKRKSAASDPIIAGTDKNSGGARRSAKPRTKARARSRNLQSEAQG